MRIFRWLITVPVAVLGWYIGMFVGLFIYGIGEWTCPAEYIVSGNCFAPWSSLLLSIAVAVGTAVAACFIVRLPTLVAPSHRWAIAFTAFMSGLAFAVYVAFTVRSNVWAPFTSAVLSGVGTLWFIRRTWGGSNSSLKLSAGL